MTRKPFNWPRSVFIFVPLLIVTVDAVVLVAESLEPDTEKAIRLVRESNSRKENFTLQQYLYMTVYHRKANGEPITIEGWRATAPGEPRAPIAVEFSYVGFDRQSTLRFGRRISEWLCDAEKRNGARPLVALSNVQRRFQKQATWLPFSATLP